MSKRIDPLALRDALVNLAEKRRDEAVGKPHEIAIMFYTRAHALLDLAEAISAASVEEPL